MMVDLSDQFIRNQTTRTRTDTTPGEVIRWVALTALYLGLILAYCWNQKEIHAIKVDLQQLADKQIELEEANSNLKAEKLSLINPKKISSQARAMGMISSNQPGVRILEAEKQLPGTDGLVALAVERGVLRE